MLRKQKQTDLIRLFRFVIPSRLELEMSEPKSDVLPLHHGTILSGKQKTHRFLYHLNPLFASAKVLCFFVLTKFFENFSAKMLFFVPFELFLQGERCSRS